MERVTGIGGVFFKSKDPKALMRWYETHLGLEPDGEWGKMFGWREKDGPEVIGGTVWSPFNENTRYLDPSPSSWMINYRVRNLDAMLEQLRQAGAQIVGDVENYDYGRFGWVLDPEGNKLELWQPPVEPGFGHLTNLTLFVSDQERARDWYVQTLGFTLRSDEPFTWPGDTEPKRWITVSPAAHSPLQIALAPAVSAEQKALIGKMPPLTFRSDDCQADYDRLRARGVEFSSPPTRLPWGTSAVFTDPDGNSFQLLEPPSS